MVRCRFARTRLIPLYLLDDIIKPIKKCSPPSIRISYSQRPYREGLKIMKYLLIPLLRIADIQMAILRNNLNNQTLVGTSKTFSMSGLAHKIDCKEQFFIQYMPWLFNNKMHMQQKTQTTQTWQLLAPHYVYKLKNHWKIFKNNNQCLINDLQAYNILISATYMSHD